MSIRCIPLFVAVVCALAGCVRVRPTAPTFTPVAPSPDITKFTDTRK